jgi:hypothetical protein
MTVRELRDRLREFEGETQVVVYAEGDTSSQLFEIDEVSTETGTPSRSEEGKPLFAFDKGGAARWLFISVSED